MHEKTVKLFEEKYMAENEVVGNLREELLKAKSELGAHGGIDHAQQAR